AFLAVHSGSGLANLSLWRFVCPEPSARSVGRDLKTIESMSVRASHEGDPIAIIGLGCRFPGATGPAAFWSLLARGGDSVGVLPPARQLATDARGACGSRQQ